MGAPMSRSKLRSNFMLRSWKSVFNLMIIETWTRTLSEEFRVFYCTFYLHFPSFFTLVVRVLSFSKSKIQYQLRDSMVCIAPTIWSIFCYLESQMAPHWTHGWLRLNGCSYGYLIYPRVIGLTVQRCNCVGVILRAPRLILKN